MCEHKNKIENEKVFSNGIKHIEIRCADCKKWLAYKGQGGEPKLYFGKYKNRTLKEIASEDPEYLHWLYSAKMTKKKLQDQINEVLSL